MSTLDQLSRAALDRAPESQALEYEHRWFSWGELRGIGDEVARLLTEAGVAERQTVAFVPRNRPSACAAELGMIAARYSISMVYAFQAAAGIARDVGKVGAAAVVAGEDDFTPELLAVVAEQGLAAIALGENSARVIEGAARSTATGVAPTPEPQIAVHTSGTTGAPKNVGFTYETIAQYMVGQNVASAATSGTIDETTPPTLLTFPLGNISGIYGLLPTLLAGKRGVLLDRFTLDHWRDFVRRYQPPMPVLPPAAITMVLDADIPPEELSCIKMIMTGAAPLDPTVQQRFQDRYNVPILLSYGATEFGGPVTLMTPDDYKEFGVAKIGTVGRPFAGAQLRAINAETGEVLPAGEEGLLEVVAPRIGDHWILNHRHRDDRHRRLLVPARPCGRGHRPRRVQAAARDDRARAAAPSGSRLGGGRRCGRQAARAGSGSGNPGQVRHDRAEHRRTRHASSPARLCDARSDDVEVRRCHP